MAPTNHLASEPSPYLQQHAENPVDWYPWGEEAFKKAKEEDKPIFLSVGYSTCHWCHVMAHESFEDSDVAELMNDAFVNIKVDREERPDVDQVYMLVCQMLNGHGGWPLTIVMTPDKKPFFAATYIPKQQRGGHMGLMELIPKIKEMWQGSRDKINNSADEINGHLKKVEQMPQGEAMGKETAKAAYQNLSQKYDSMHGGFGQAPKFPSPHNITFMLKYGHLFGQRDAIDMASTTLKAMRLGGVFDHVGNGFHRYATDAQWLVPHFEKMLYDQAMLLHAYTEGWQVTGDPLFRQTAYEIADYLKDRLTSPEGVFYSAEDADSEGEEGKFYVWSVDELREVLDPESAERVISVFNATEEGNYRDEATGERTGKNILHLSSDLEEYADYAGYDPGEFKELVNQDLKKLYQAREKRVRPHRDEKVLTDWNALMISALARAARVFDDDEMKSMAGTAACFLLGNLKTEEGTLLHRYGDGQAAIEGHADDYAYLIWAMLECFETTQDPTYLNEAKELQDIFETHFWDVNGGFYFTSDQGEQLLIRNKEGFDGALPSANSVALHNMVRLSRITGNMEYSQRAEAIGKQFSQYGQKAPDGFTHMLQGVLFGRQPGYEIILAGNPDEKELMNMYHTVASQYLPNSITLLLPNENAGNQRSDLENTISYLEHYPKNHDQATAYVCRNYACEKPVHSVDELKELL